MTLKKKKTRKKEQERNMKERSIHFWNCLFLVLIIKNMTYQNFEIGRTFALRKCES